MNNQHDELSPLSAVTPEARMYSHLWLALADEYATIKQVFDWFKAEQLARSKGSLLRRKPIVLSDVYSAMVDSGIQLNIDTVRVLHAYATGSEYSLSPGRKTVLLEFARSASIFPNGGSAVTDAQWVALDRTEKWVTRDSMESGGQALRSQAFSERYSVLARGMYHLLRKELGRAPVGEDLRDALMSSAAVDGRQKMITAWLETLVPGSK